MTRFDLGGNRIQRTPGLGDARSWIVDESLPLKLAGWFEVEILRPSSSDALRMTRLEMGGNRIQRTPVWATLVPGSLMNFSRLKLAGWFAVEILRASSSDALRMTRFDLSGNRIHRTPVWATLVLGSLMNLSPLSSLDALKLRFFGHPHRMPSE
jgi:hypothetical protein